MTKKFRVKKAIFFASESGVLPKFLVFFRKRKKEKWKKGRQRERLKGQESVNCVIGDVIEELEIRLTSTLRKAVLF